MSLYFLPALIILIFKILILAVAMKGGRSSIAFLSLIVVFACHNAIELVGYIQFLSGETVEMLFRPYYVITIYLLMYVLLHALTISGYDRPAATRALLATATLLSILILFTDIVVAGQYSIGYSVTAIQGDYYWLFSLYTLISLLTSVVVLSRGYQSTTSQLNSIRCAYSLFALAPVILVSLIAIVLKTSGAEINAAGLMPVATTIFLILVLKGESKHQLTDLRRFLPWSPERQTSNEFMRLMDEYVNNEKEANAYKNLREGIERQIILYTLKKCDNNVTKASEMMGFDNRSTLYSMMNRLDINHKKADNKL